MALSVVDRIKKQKRVILAAPVREFAEVQEHQLVQLCLVRGPLTLSAGGGVP